MKKGWQLKKHLEQKFILSVYARRFYFFKKHIMHKVDYSNCLLKQHRTFSRRHVTHNVTRSF